MTGDACLKKKTRQAYGKKRRHPWNAPQKKADNVRPSSPDAAEALHSDDDAQPRAPVVSETVHSPELSCSISSDCLVVGSSRTSSNIQDRIDTAFYSEDEFAECARNAASLKASLASKCATERKFKLLDVDLENDGKENGTEFGIVDLAVIDLLFRLVACPECGEKSLSFSKGKREYGLCAKLVVTCSSCDFREERFSSPRVADETDAKIRPFEVNLRAMKAINSIGKGGNGSIGLLRRDEHFASRAPPQDLSKPHDANEGSVQCDSCRAQTLGASTRELWRRMRSPPPHKDSLPDFVSEALEPVFRRLSDGALLERCSDGITQNPSESLHSVIWQQAPKTQHASLRSIERAVAEAISRFNQGMTKSNIEIAEKLGYNAGYNLVRRSLEKDKNRLQKSQREHHDSNTTKTTLAKRHKPTGNPAYSPGLL
ncbi:hypothetical protein MTO96_026641 [Rhipicephalus appendiculatus]